jgi:hypothetical protein
MLYIVTVWSNDTYLVVNKVLHCQIILSIGTIWRCPVSWMTHTCVWGQFVDMVQRIAGSKLFDRCLKSSISDPNSTEYFAPFPGIYNFICKKKRVDLVVRLSINPSIAISEKMWIKILKNCFRRKLSSKWTERQKVFRNLNNWICRISTLWICNRFNGKF